MSPHLRSKEGSQGRLEKTDTREGVGEWRKTRRPRLVTSFLGRIRGTFDYLRGLRFGYSVLVFLRFTGCGMTTIDIAGPLSLVWSCLESTAGRLQPQKADYNGLPTSGDMDRGSAAR